MTWSAPITRYDIQHYGKRAAANHPLASVKLFDNNNALRGWVFFLADDQALSDANEVTPGSAVHFYMHISQLRGVVDTLRNEEPIALWYLAPTWVILATGTEPVGEEET